MEEPKTIARYRLTGELGRGGMGVVYRAEDPQLGRPVAIKVILFPPHASDDFRGQLEARFEREARAAAGIHHPGVVTVFDFGRDGEYLYLVMELVDGESLADRLRKGWRPERAEAFEIVAKAADGLAAAHAAGVVHRDVTPRNILLAADGRVLVTDFGIARSLGEETLELTSTGMLVGSPSFMAPEQVRSRDLDARADLFSLGVVLYLLLVGELPFKSGDLTALLYQIVHEDPLDGTGMQGRLGLGAHAFLAKCLAKSPADRIQTAAELGREARRLQAEAEATEIEETVALGMLKDQAPGSRPSAGGRALLGLAAVAVVVAGAWLASRALRDEAPAPSARPSPARREATLAPGEVPAPPPPPAPAMPAPGEEPEAGAATAEEPAPLPPAVPPRSTEPPPPPPAREAESEASAAAPRGEPAIERPPAVVETGAAPVESSPPPADTVPPVLAIDTQPREATSSRIVLSGRVMDDSDGSGVRLSVNDEPVVVGDDGDFHTERRLEPGRNRLSVVAVDSSGNQVMKTIDVTLETAAKEPPTGAETAAAQPGPRQGPERPRFADHGDGTLRDTLTGLTWAKRPSDEISTWRASKSYCKKLELGREEDWLLPTVEELEELFLAGVGIPSSAAWSSSKAGSGAAWAFDYGQGQRIRQAVNSKGASGPRVLCVRRPPRPTGPLPRLQNPGSGPQDTGTTGDARNPGGSRPPQGGAPPPPSSPPPGGGQAGRGSGG